jgi:RNA polymerase II-associated protein 2
MAPKPILKNRENPNQLQELANTETPEQRNRRIALFHAHRIQAQKDVEQQVFEATEAFIDFPLVQDASSVAPAPSDVAKFQDMIKPFRPSDYDALLDERRMANRCGYVFCPNPPKKPNTSGKYKILGMKKGQTFKVVEAQKLELWCSPECARRALYIKVQLIEEPAWLRRGGISPEITLLTGDDSAAPVKEMPRNFTDDQLKQAMQDLALERGDDRIDSRPANLVKETVVEKEHNEAPLPVPGSSKSIEGYEPKPTEPGSFKRPIRPR